MSHAAVSKKDSMNTIREYSIPLLAGIAVALVWANLDQAGYNRIINGGFLGRLSVGFIANDIFMVFFFAIAATEITRSCIPGGDLNPPRKALNPLCATFGGVLGPVTIYLCLNHLFGAPSLTKGWGIPTATDISIGWLVARIIFGSRHPAVSYLLLLAIVDDAIGLAVIAIFYPDPSAAFEPVWLILVCAGMIAAWVMRWQQVKSYWPYILCGGLLSWIGLYRSHLHPALALVFIVPFLPHRARESKHIFEENKRDRSPLAVFEHQWKGIVDMGMFFFGLANAGVALSSMGCITWLVAASLFFGKTSGIFLFGALAAKKGYHLPHGMALKDLFVVALVGTIGFTVSLFIDSVAFAPGIIQDQARMGALLSLLFAPIAVGVARLMGRRKTLSVRNPTISLT